MPENAAELLKRTVDAQVKVIEHPTPLRRDNEDVEYDGDSTDRTNRFRNA